MKGKIVMKVRPCKDGGDRIMTKVDLKRVGSQEKVALLKSFLRGLEMPVEEAVGHLLMIAKGAAECVVMKDVKDAMCEEEVCGDA